MTLKNQRVSKKKDGKETIGVILDAEPNVDNLVLVHWGVADNKKYRTLEDVLELDPIESPPRPTEGGVGWED